MVAEAKEGEPSWVRCAGQACLIRPINERTLGVKRPTKKVFKAEERKTGLKAPGHVQNMEAEKTTENILSKENKR